MYTTKISLKTPLSPLAGSKLMAIKNPQILIPALKKDEIQLVEKVRSISLGMKKLPRNSMEELVMVDTIQRLGIDHLFQEETNEVLTRHYLECLSQSSGVVDCNFGLHEASLRFRLLRQGGHNVNSTNTFEGFLGKDRKFKEELSKNTQGIVSLFEASQMSTHGEWILDEANVFSNQILDRSHTLRIKNTLKYPIQKTLARFTAHDYLTTTPSSGEGWRNELLELAKMDFNVARSIYQNEIIHITKWWKELGLTKELKFARDQPLKWHMWSLGSLPDPSLSEQRIDITKSASFVYIIDDIFDVYGTFEDLSLFTEAVNRWELETFDMLPRYMKLCLKALFDVTDEIGHKIWLKYGYNPKNVLRKSWADLFNAFLAESKWFATGYVPTTAEYLKVATITSGVHVVLTHVYFILGGGSEACEHSATPLDTDYNKIISSTAIILRLWDDLGSSEDEDQDGHDGSYIKCYMNEFEDVRIEFARERVAYLISKAWKCLNKESMVVNNFTKGCLNVARMVPLMYNYDKNHKLRDLEKFVALLLYHRY